MTHRSASAESCMANGQPVVCSICDLPMDVHNTPCMRPMGFKCSWDKWLFA